MRASLALAFLVLLIVSSRRPGPPTAPVLYTGATVYRAWDAGPAVAAILVEGGGVRFVGDEREARALAPEARVVDLAGTVVVPGLTDAHGHVRGLGALRRALDVRGLSKEEILARVKSRAAAAAPGEWIRGRNWDQNRWADTSFPTAAALGAAAPKTPVVLWRVDGHAIWANAAALRAAGITKGTGDPPGGRIERLEDGSPAGVLVDNAMALVTRAIPEPGPDEIRRDILAGLEACAKAGLTGVGEASGSPLGDLAIFESLAREGKLPIRVYATVGPKALDTMLARGPILEGRLTVRALKIVADGALGSRGAALLEDYSDAPGNRGLDVTPPGETERLAEKALRGGFQVWTHAIGDRANRVTLDAYEKALAAVHPLDPRPRIEHVQILTPPDAERFGKLGVIASVQPTHATSDMPWAETRIGKGRIEGSYAWRTLAESRGPPRGRKRLSRGIREPPPRHLRGRDAAGPLGTSAGRLAEGAGAHARRGAPALHGRQRVRRVRRDTARPDRPRYDADFTVLDRDIVSEKTPDAEIPKAKVRMTVVGGEIVYAASATPGTSTSRPVRTS